MEEDTKDDSSNLMLYKREKDGPGKDIWLVKAMEAWHALPITQT